MNVDILCDGKFISATVTVDNYSNYKFAFYLYCNGERIEIVWYQKKSSVIFVSKLVSRSRYVVRAFVKKDNEIISINSRPFLYDFPRYYMEQWSDRYKIFIRDLKNINNSFDELLTKENKIYHFVDKNHERYLDILFHNMEYVYDRKTILVHFHAAIREDTRLPIFAGVGIAKRLSFPLVAISDPSLKLSHDLLVSWYTGNYLFQDLPRVIADFLNKLQDYFKCKIILLGGSGGGFASLLFYKLMNNPNVSCFVWNPQTDISKSPRYQKYIDICFSAKNEEFDEKRYFDTFNLFNLNKLYIRDNAIFGKILYYQVFSDDYYVQHCMPFLNTLEIGGVSGNTYVKDNFALFIDRKSCGHVAPRKHIIFYVLDSLYNDVDLSCILYNIDNNVNGVDAINIKIM